MPPAGFDPAIRESDQRSKPDTARRPESADFDFVQMRDVLLKTRF